MARAFADIAFTPSVQAKQADMGSAKAYSNLLSGETIEGDALTEQEAGFISQRDGFYQASVSETGWPYVQFRGGQAGFLRVLDEKTIAYADLRGNRQYVSTGNLATNDRISLILMDYPNQRRLKVWGRVKLVEAATDLDLVARVQVEGYRGRVERVVVINVEAFDWNCPAHIPQRLTVEEFEQFVAPLRAQLAHLAEENRELKAFFGKT